MGNRQKKYMRETRTVKTSYVFPPDTNHLGTLFGGKLMAYIDDTASIAAAKLARCTVVTASTDSVDFIAPIRVGNVVTVEAIVTWTGRTSMEVFVKVSAEDLKTEETSIAAISFLTFVALDENGKPTPVPEVVPETDEERWLNETAKQRAEQRLLRKKQSEEMARYFSNAML
ncbi:putative acyl-CoA thioester hydrolase YkhA [Weizmannia acidilactici]|uniref:Acyl-CoA thioester hydrolase YkhA n=1 Tax=Weizmannia acidilactici TaxID=2607726 RepID=A0A5J4JJ79_9BACI|nr:acyl-CoA thioesterase [Weizmannia acidilactici]GER70610.1 putative acyl-CoA thioester hydrolase YkhA [Weizmannia acidilactici]GER73783.1 putative acyl-CoA thioester hydrolase YkhA [Weizmannia acidilactici]